MLFPSVPKQLRGRTEDAKRITYPNNLSGNPTTHSLAFYVLLLFYRYNRLTYNTKRIVLYMNVRIRSYTYCI